MAFRCTYLILLHFLLSAHSAVNDGNFNGHVEPSHPYLLEVKGPASQALHKQSLEYLSRMPQIEKSGSEADSKLAAPLLPPSIKSSTSLQHASVLSVAVYTLLMACATVKQNLDVVSAFRDLMLSMLTGSRSCTFLLRP